MIKMKIKITTGMALRRAQECIQPQSGDQRKGAKVQRREAESCALKLSEKFSPGGERAQAIKRLRLCFLASLR